MPTYVGTVYRGLTLPHDELNSILGKLKRGGTYTIDRHSSASTARSIAKGFYDSDDGFNVLFTIRQRTGRRVPGDFGEGGEKEVILPKGMKIKLNNISFEKGHVRIDAQETK